MTAAIRMVGARTIQSHRAAGVPHTAAAQDTAAAHRPAMVHTRVVLRMAAAHTILRHTVAVDRTVAEVHSEVGPEPAAYRVARAHKTVAPRTVPVHPGPRHTVTADVLLER